MSFQDVRPGASTHGPAHRQHISSCDHQNDEFKEACGDNMKDANGRNILSSNADASRSKVNMQGGSSPRRVSNDILRYQRELGSLTRTVHAKHPRSSSAEWRLKMRFEEVQKLGDSIESQLQRIENDMVQASKNEASESRATHMKLTRDFRQLEVIFRNMKMDFIRKQGKQNLQILEDKENSIRSVGDQNEATRLQQLQLQDEASEQIMRERQVAISDINRKMHQVNEIYRDLGQLVNDQQEQVDDVETMMDAANVNAQAALQQLEKANGTATQVDRTINPETPTYQSHTQCNWMLPLETMKEIGEDITAMGSNLKTRAIFFCALNPSSK